MRYEDKVNVAEMIGEALIGGAVGICLKKTVLPKCTTFEKFVVLSGMTTISGMIGAHFYRRFHERFDVPEFVENDTDTEA